MRQEPELSPGAPMVSIAEGQYQGCKGPVVGIDQQRGTVMVRIARLGVRFGAKQEIIEIDVRKVRRVISHVR